MCKTKKVLGLTMAYNNILFEKIYEDCLNIIKSTEDKNIKAKKKILDFAYSRINMVNNCEVQEFYGVVHELKTYKMLELLNQHPMANDDNKAGCDFICKFGNIECVTFNKPTDEDSIRILNGSCDRHKALDPRLSQAIESKMQKYKKYLTNKQIDVNKPNIICVNAGVCSYEIHQSTYIKACEKILYGITDALLINIKENKMEFAKTIQDKIIKPNGKEIKINFFCNPDYRIISGVLYINNLINENYNSPILYINPNADIKIDKRYVRKFLSFIKEGSTKYYYSCNGQKLSTITVYK